MPATVDQATFVVPALISAEHVGHFMMSHPEGNRTALRAWANDAERHQELPVQRNVQLLYCDATTGRTHGPSWPATPRRSRPLRPQPALQSRCQPLAGSGNRNWRGEGTGKRLRPT